EQRWRERLVAGQAAVLVADGRAGLLGFAAFGPSRDDDLDPSQVGEIYAIYLLPKAWGQGHGSALLRQALDKLQAQGLDETTLWVLRDNQRAIDFYQAHGFQADGAAKHETRGDSVILHEVRFRRRP
ncbi:MAG: GNAT family N-acetyltransferase, partial [Anaerolineae bacterium]